MLHYLIGQFAVVSKWTDSTAYIKQWSCTERIFSVVNNILTTVIRNIIVDKSIDNHWLVNCSSFLHLTIKQIKSDP